jgi:predicted ATPase
VSDEAEDVRTRLVPLDALLLDPNNPRLIEDPLWPRVADEEIPKARVQRETAERLLGERGGSVRRLLESIESLGWVDADPVRVRELPGGKLIVLDGNRRVVALRRHREEQGSSNAHFLRVVVDTDALGMEGRKAHGARHTRGRSRWSPLGAAVWRREMRRQGAEIALESDYEDGVLDLCIAYRQSRWGERFRPKTFVLFQRLMGGSAVRTWLGHGPNGFQNPENVQRLFLWMYTQPDWEIHQVMLDILLSLPDGAALLEAAEGDFNVVWRSSMRESPAFAAERVETAQKNLVEMRRLIEAAGEEPVEPTSERPWPLMLSESGPNLTSLRVSKYRGLSAMNLDGLTRINLLVGPNNVGKTSVLEAIYLLCRRSDPRGLLDSIRARVRTDPERLPAARLVSLLPGSSAIAGTLASGAVVEVEQVAQDEPTDDSANLATFLRSLRIDARGAGEQQVSSTEFYANRPRRTQVLAGSRAWLAPSIFHSPFSLADRKVLTSCYERSLETGTKAEVVDFIRQHVDEDLEDIDLANIDGQFLVTQRSGGALDLSSYGEGMQRIFQIGLLFAAHAHGIVLIDEFENALHTSVLKSFSRMIQELAVRFDVQVFLTTHSDEALQAFLLNDYRTEDVTTFLLKKDGGRITARRFDGESHKQALDFAGVDVRRL